MPDNKPVAVQEIPFYGDRIMAAVVEEAGRQEVYVAISPICESLGIAANMQRRKIQNNPLFSGKVLQYVMILEKTSSQARDVMVLHLDMLTAWLMTINVNRVKPEARDKLLAYQREAAAVLRDYFLGPGYAVNPARADLLKLEIELEKIKLDRELELARTELEREKARFKAEQEAGQKELLKSLVAFTTDNTLPAEFRQALLSKIAGLEPEPVTKYRSTSEIASMFSFEFGQPITAKRISMLAKAQGIRPDREAGEMENEYAVVSVTKAAHADKTVEQVLYNEHAVQLLRMAVRDWLSTSPKKRR